jgi:catechol 2,3-dioxygenase-like lactoylglutathione lyase family enzyme
MNIPLTLGVDHVGLSVRSVRASSEFFVKCLEWKTVGGRPDYPAIFVSDGSTRLTLWQVTDPVNCTAFDRRQSIGLHHLALKVADRASLGLAYGRIVEWPGVVVEFPPEPSGQGPKFHTMLREPGGTRIELSWDPR